MSKITEELHNFTTSMNIQGKYEDPHARTNWDKEMEKLEESFKNGHLQLSDYQTKKANLMRTMMAKKK